MSADRSWYAADRDDSLAAITRVRDEPPPRPTVAGMFYAGSTATIFGEPDAGKSMFLAAVSSRVVADGGTVLWVDYEQGERRVVERLLAFGLTPEQIAHSVYRVHHPAGLPDAEWLSVYGGVTLAAFDGFTGLLAAIGGSSNADTDVEAVYAGALRPLSATGTAVVALDHVAKDRENRGRWAIGSQRKIGAPDQAYMFNVERRFKPEHGGVARLTVSRDRAGGLAVIHFTLDDDLAWRIEADTEPDRRLTGWMERISEHLAATASGASGNAIAIDLGGKAANVRSALRSLIDEGNVVIERRGTANIHRLVRPYSESIDPKIGSSSRLVLSSSPPQGDEPESDLVSFVSPLRSRGTRDEVNPNGNQGVSSLTRGDEVEWLEQIAATEAAREVDA